MDMFLNVSQNGQKLWHDFLGAHCEKKNNYLEIFISKLVYLINCIFQNLLMISHIFIITG